MISRLESQLASKVKSVDKYREDRDEWMRKYTEMSKGSLEKVRERAALRMECVSETMRANRAERALANALDEIKRLTALRNGAQTCDKVPVLGSCSLFSLHNDYSLLFRCTNRCRKFI